MPTTDREFCDPAAADDLSWEPAPGHPDGIRELVLYEDDDGSHSRFVEFDPGVETDAVLSHDFYEEALILEGGLIDRTLDEAFTAGMYACRTPGMEHGPYATPVGCTTFEIRYYE